MMPKVIADRYELLELIGQGGMADVYLAKDLILNRVVAIKILRTSLAKDPVYVTRFQREASAAAALSHQNIVEIYDVGEDGDRYYIVMEYVQGATLKELINRRGALHVLEAVDIMKQAISGVTKAHQLGIVHRDLKPQNILVTDTGTAKIADFGIASMQSLAQVTQTDVIMGSLHYLAPELARGEKATNQSDIYALGIVFYELLRGEVPFSGESPVNIAIKHMQSEIPSIREFNPSILQSVENIVIKATAKNLNDRYQNAAEMLDDINTCTERTNEEKIVFDYDQNTDPTIVLDSRSMFNGNTGEISPVTNANDHENTNKGGFIAKIKALNIWAKLALGVIPILLIGTIIYLGFFSNNVDTKMMPDIVGMTIDEAKVALKGYNVTINDKPKEEMSDDYDAGKIIKSDPKVGATIKEGDKITVVISKGKYAILGDYTGMTYEKAKAELEALGFVVNKETVESEKAEGIVLEQSIIKGEKVDPTIKDKSITLSVSVGVTITVPNVVGLDINIAKAKLEELGFVVELKPLTPPTSEEEILKMNINKVEKQSIEAFTDVKQKNQTITIYYYDHKPEIPKKPDPTVPTEETPEQTS